MKGLYVKLDANFFTDNRVVECSPLAQLLYIQALCLAKRDERDGILSVAQLTASGAQCGSTRDPLRYMRELVSCSLVEQLDACSYRIIAWSEHNKSAAEIEEIRRHRVEAGRRGGLASGASRRMRREADEPEAKQLAFSKPSNLRTEQTETQRKRETDDSHGRAAFPACDDAQDDPRLGEVCRLYSRRATERATGVEDRHRYEVGVTNNLLLERGAEIRRLLESRPSARSEQIVDLLESGAAVR